MKEVADRLEDEGFALLEGFCDLSPEALGSFSRSYDPLSHSYSTLEDTAALDPLLEALSSLGRFEVEVLRLAPSDYMIVPEGAMEEGVVGFLRLTTPCARGGALVIDDSPVVLEKGSLLLVKGVFRWYVERLSSRDEAQVFVILRSVL